MRAGRDLGGDFGRCRFIASVSHRGMTSAAPLPSLGQIAPKMYAEAVRWSFGALGRVPRLAQQPSDLVHSWPMQASSANQISTVAEIDVLLARDLVHTELESFYIPQWRPLGLGMMARIVPPSLAISDRAQLAAQGL